ncbi:MAG: acylneuraminate cytidylyltransferase family protein [Lachnospiraceae bacterium]|nr:acylneuraminate cytidylyltransferase family protein [Lachnospiraceae bacterium]
MYKGKNFLAIVPARGGSKGIPYKNIALVNGKPLISYTLEAAKESKYIDMIYVSTEDEKIAKVVNDAGFEVLKRPEELAGDTTKTIEVLVDIVAKLEKTYDYLVLLQPTQPLREGWHIDEAIEKMIDNECSSLVSISPVSKHPVLIRSIGDDNKVKPLLNMSSTVRRQDFEKYYIVNGAIYINRVDDININTSLNDNEYGYIMDEKYDLDIDEPLDLFIFEKRVQEYENWKY